MEKQTRRGSKGATPRKRGNGMDVRVRDIMSTEVACCTPDMGVAKVAKMMLEHDCGEIPVVEDLEERRPIGVVTDRDIVTRLIAPGRNPLECQIGDCMTSLPVTVMADANVGECSQLMEEHRIRRLPVVDDAGLCCGIVSQADLALKAPREITAEVVREVSQPA